MNIFDTPYVGNTVLQSATATAIGLVSFRVFLLTAHMQSHSECVRVAQVSFTSLGFTRRIVIRAVIHFLILHNPGTTITALETGQGQGSITHTLALPTILLIDLFASLSIMIGWCSIPNPSCTWRYIRRSTLCYWPAFHRKVSDSPLRRGRGSGKQW